MAGLNGISAYQQTINSVNSSKSASVYGSDKSDSAKETKVDIKTWLPISSTSSLVPRQTEYGSTIGDVELSDKAKEYYKQLKAKYNNMEFIAVSSDMKTQVQANAASYGNASKMVVLVDDEKLERMATDESFRKKYEGIIAMAQGQLNEAKNSLTSSGASVKNFGMSVDSKGNTSFFATIEKNGELQQKRIEKKLAEKKELKAKEKKEAAKEAKEERIEAAREKRAEKSVDNEKRVFGEDGDYAKPDAAFDEKEYVTIKATTLEDLLSKVQDYSYSGASDRVMTEGEKMLGGHVDFRY